MCMSAVSTMSSRQYFDDSILGLRVYHGILCDQVGLPKTACPQPHTQLGYISVVDELFDS